MSNTESPRAPFRPLTTELHGETRVDGYGYLKDREDPETIPYLKRKTHTLKPRWKRHQACRNHSLRSSCLESRKMIKASPTVMASTFIMTVLRRESRTQFTAERALRKARKRRSSSTLISLPKAMNTHRSGAVALVQIIDISPTVWTTPATSSIRVVVKDLTTGEHLPGKIENAYYGLEWGNDNATIFFTRVDEAHRPDRLFRTSLDDLDKETIVLEEPDDRFFLSLGKSQSEDYIFISLDSAITSEVHIIEAAAPTQEPKLFAARKDGVEYNVSHWNDRFLILTNEDAQNFKLMETKRDTWAPENWRELIPQSDDTLQAVIPFKSFLAMYRRHNGLPEIVLYEPGADGLQFPRHPSLRCNLGYLARLQCNV